MKMTKSLFGWALMTLASATISLWSHWGTKSLAPLAPRLALLFFFFEPEPASSVLHCSTVHAKGARASWSGAKRSPKSNSDSLAIFVVDAILEFT